MSDLFGGDGGGWGAAPEPTPVMGEGWGPPEGVDPTTGEVADIVDAEVIEEEPRDMSTMTAALPAAIAAPSVAAVDFLRSPELVLGLSRVLGLRLREELEARAARLRAERTPGRVVPATVAAEVAFLADADATLSAIASTFTGAAKLARDMAGELVVDVEPEAAKGGSKTVRVGAASGGTVAVTRTQGTKASVRDDEVLDVLAAAYLEHLADEHAPMAAAGFREGVATLRRLVGPLAWKTTALEQLRQQLEAQELYALAIRLGHAYGRVATGNPTVKLERKAAE